MTKPKTLKEICWKNKIGLKDFIAFQQEAIKWIIKYRKEKGRSIRDFPQAKHLRDMIWDGKIETLKHFFNITEEDLK